MSNIVPFEHQLTLAENFASSKLFGVKTAAEALSLMAIAEAYNIHPARAVTEYHIINGRPSLKADALMARFQAAGGSITWITLTDKAAAAEFSHPQGGKVEIRWTIEMAQQAGLPNKNPTWKSYPRAMLRSRVVSEGVRTVFPGVAQGMYTPEEIQDMPADNRPQRLAREARDMGDAEVVVDAKKVMAAIKKAKSTDDLEAIRPDIRKLEGDEKQAALLAAKNKAEEIRKTSQQAEPGQRAQSEAAAEPEQDGTPEEFKNEHMNTDSNGNAIIDMEDDLI